ncbi:tetratricopeptide repeat protein [uncultured Algibacter sp.]|uniref:tetratricopeptide repeat protein n=1 Tax=uncultured Algibacter sp. TaxID=298659 RepID=UPI002633B39F|nr:tetratricopeptide repeat protein [uncultured Algibacter sp.]
MFKSILISNFTNLSRTTEDNYLEHSVPLEIIHLLSKHKSLRIISPQSKELLKSEFGKNVVVDFYLEGSFLRTKTNIRFNLQLIDAQNAKCLLSIKVEADNDNIFELIDAIALKIVQYLKFEFTTNKGHLKIDSKAYEHYLKGIRYWNLWDEKNVKSAITHFKEVIKIEPKFSLVYVRLSQCYSLLAAIITKDNFEHYNAAKTAALKAIALDNSSIEAHLSLALIKLVNDVDILSAYYSFESAFSINNSHAKAHHYYAYYLITIGKYQKAIEALEFALKEDPFNLQANSTYGFALLLSNKYDEAEQHLKKTLSTHPDSEVTYDALIWTYILSKQYEKARKMVENSKMTLLFSPALEIIIYNLLEDFDNLKLWKNKFDTLIKNDTDGNYNKDASIIYFALGDIQNSVKHFEAFYKTKMGFIRALSHPAWKTFRESDKFYIYKKRLKLLRPQMLPSKLTENRDDVIVIHSTTSEIFAVASKQLLFIESQGVYCKIVFLNEAKKIKERVIRTSLTKIMRDTFYIYFFRCHNSYIVNTKINYLISGNRKNSKLGLKDYLIEIPVSRNKTSDIFELFPRLK